LQGGIRHFKAKNGHKQSRFLVVTTRTNTWPKNFQE
jgi:hypothetical protein